MKFPLTIFKSLLIAFGLTAIAIGLTMAPRSAAKSDSPAARSDSSLPQDQDEKGTIVAALKGYDLKEHGYGFRNYGKYENIETELQAGDLIKLFGAENVCESGTTASDCVLYEPASEWLDKQFKMLGNGHCDGLAMTSLRFWLGLPFAGKSAPGDWQSGASKVSELKRNETIENYVAHIHVMQALAEISSVRRELIKNKPSGILHLLIDSMKDDSKDFFEFLIYKFEDGRLTKGHCITPYAVEDMGDGLYHVLVYDSNFPGLIKYVEINTKEESWRYHTAANPGQAASDYVGDTSTNSITLQNLAARELETYGCPFCPDNSERASLHHASRSSAPTKKEQVGFALTGEGEYLITDPNGKRIGYDFAKSRFVNEIPDADVIPVMGGLGKNVPAEYHLPRTSSTKPYTINVAGKSIDHEVDADLDMEGPGFFVGFQDLLVDPGENLTMTISPNGRELSFTASQDGETPTILITIATGHKDPSYFFEIGGIKLSPGKTFTMKLDLEKQKLFFKDNDAKRDAYDVLVARVNPDGTRNFYEHHDLEIAKKTDNYEMDFGKWDGKGEMCFEDDDEGNGFDDDVCTEEPNDKKPAKPPEVRNYFRSNQPITALLWY
jgi:hypothetical protein